MGWAFLPPIQRTLAAPIASVTRPVESPGELSAWRSPAFTDSLSHAVVDTSSGGVIDGDGGGLGHPTNTSVHAPELTLLPPPRPTAVQRSVRPAAAAPPPATASGSDVVRPAPSFTRAPSAGMPLVHRAVVDDPTPDLTPDLTPVPEPVPDPGPVPAPAPVPGPEPAEQNESVAPESVDPAEPPPSDTPAGPVDQVTAPLGHASAPSPEPLAPAGRPETVQRSVDAPLAPPPVATSPSPATQVGETRPHLGLGPPLASVPETAVSAPPPDPDNSRLSLSGQSSGESSDPSGFTEIPIQRTVSPPASAPVSPVTPSPPETPPRPDLTLPTAGVAAEPKAVEPTADEPAAVEPESPADIAPDIAADPPAATAPSPVVAEPSAAAAADSPVAATLSSVPLPLGGGLETSIQRSSTLPGPGTPTPTLVVRPAPLIPGPPSRERVVPIQRMPATEPPSPPARPAPSAPTSRSANQGAQVAVARSATSRAMDLPAMDRPASGPELPTAAPPLQRATGSSGQTTTIELPDAVPEAHEQESVPPAPTAVNGGFAGPSVLPSDVSAPAPGGGPTGPAAALPVSVSRAATLPTTPAVTSSIGPAATPSIGPSVTASVTPTISRSTAPAPAPGVLPLARSATPDLPVQTAAVGAPEPGLVDVSGHSAPWPDASSALDTGQVVVARALDPAAADAAPAAATGSASGGAPGGAAPGGEDVEALAQRLFPPMLRRLKNEFLLDRERRGMRTDAW